MWYALAVWSDGERRVFSASTPEEAVRKAANFAQCNQRCAELTISTHEENPDAWTPEEILRNEG